MDLIWGDTHGTAGAGQHIDAGFKQNLFQSIAVQSHGVGATDLHDFYGKRQSSGLCPNLPQQSLDDFLMLEFFHDLRTQTLRDTLE